MRAVVVLALVVVTMLWGSLAHAAAPIGAPLSTLALTGKAHGLHLVGTRVYVATELGMSIVDVADPAAPALLGRLPSSSATRSEAVVVGGGYAYLASPVGGLLVVDIQNPAAPTLVTTRRVSGGLWDIAIKDHVIYAVSFSGEMYLFDVEGAKAAAPVQIKVLGLPAWQTAGQDAANLAKLQSQVTVGNAKATGVAVDGNYVFAVDWAYGRLYVWDATNPELPVFAGTHAAPYLLKVVADVTNDVVYMLSAYGRTSGIYTVPLSILEPTSSTRHATCTQCGYLASLFAVDMGDLALTPTGNHLVWAGGKGLGEIHVVDVASAPAMVDVASDDIGSHGVAMAYTIGIATMGDYLLVGAGLKGLQIYLVPALAP